MNLKQLDECTIQQPDVCDGQKSEALPQPNCAEPLLSQTPTDIDSPLREVSEARKDLETEMEVRIKRRIINEARKCFSRRIDPDDNSWPEIVSLARIYGENEVFLAFTKWASPAEWDDLFPLYEFSFAADSLLKSAAIVARLPRNTP
jgi:hypothetical protein